MSAGACVFFVAGTGAASAATPHPAVKATTQSSCDLVCQLRNTWNKITGTGHQANPPANPPSSSHTTTHSGSTHSGSSTSHTSHSTGSSHSSATNGLTTPMNTPGGTAPVAAPQTAQLPQLPEIAGDQSPVVFPGQPNTPARQVHLESAAAQDQTVTVTPELVATAAGLIGVVAALNLSVLSRRLRRPQTR